MCQVPIKRPNITNDTATSLKHTVKKHMAWRRGVTLRNHTCKCTVVPAATEKHPNECFLNMSEARAVQVLVLTGLIPTWAQGKASACAGTVTPSP